MVDGIPVTSVARTLVDLGGTVSESVLRRAWEQAEILRLLDVQAVRAALRCGRSGSRAVAQLLVAHAREEPEDIRSLLETRFRELCTAWHLPFPVCNAPLRVGGRTYRPDALWREQRLIVELDSWRFHGTRAAFEHDRVRSADLVVEGWRVLHVTWRRLDEHPEQVAAMIGRALGVISLADTGPIGHSGCRAAR